MKLRRILAYTAAAKLGYVAVQALFVLWTLGRIDPRRTLAERPNEAPAGRLLDQLETTPRARIRRTVEDGIERVTYSPHERRFETPILLVHGMWHGAWCWSWWQALLAEWGWESTAISLPGHGASPLQRPLWRCTLDYYLSFVARAVEDLPHRPVLVGHSMGGALVQWYLRYVGDDLPAAVLVAPWVAHSVMLDGVPLLLRDDPLAISLTSLAWSAAPWVRTPRRAAEKLITEGAIISPNELYNRLGGESALVTLQHNPPFWTPPTDVRTPLLWLAGERDAIMTEAGQRRSARHYGADFMLAANQGHNLMMESQYDRTIGRIHAWLVERGIG